MQLTNLTWENQLASLVDILGYEYKYGTYWKNRIEISQVTNIISHYQQLLEDLTIMNHYVLSLLRITYFSFSCMHWLLSKTTVSGTQVDKQTKKGEINREVWVRRFSSFPFCLNYTAVPTIFMLNTKQEIVARIYST